MIEERDPPRPSSDPSESAASAAARPRLLYREVLDTIDPDFEKAFALYERAFPEDERVPRDYFVVALEAKRAGRMSPGNFRFLVCREGTEVVGFCAGRYLEPANVGIVGYLAVEPTVKGRRIGSGLRRHLVRGFRRDADLAGHADLEAVVGEIEADNPWISILVGQRRVFALDLAYEQPILHPGGSPVPLVLYYQPIRSSDLPDALPAEKVETLLREIFRTVYRIDRPEESPVFRRLAGELRAKKRIGPLDLEAEKKAQKARRRAAGGAKG